MLTELGPYFSSAGGFCVFFFALLVMRGFVPRTLLPPRDEPEEWLRNAIFLGALALTVNTVIWQFGGNYVDLVFGSVTRAEYRQVMLIPDGVIKFCAAGSMAGHLAARLYNIPREKRDGWNILNIAFYPRGLGLRQLCAALFRR